MDEVDKMLYDATTKAEFIQTIENNFFRYLIMNNDSERQRAFDEVAKEFLSKYVAQEYMETMAVQNVKNVLLESVERYYNTLIKVVRIKLATDPE